MKKLSLLTLATSSLLSYPSLCLADDAEIFFNDKLAPAKPNVIFLLDVSGSMGWVPFADISSPPPYTSKKLPNTRYTQSRMDILKGSLTKLLTNKDITQRIRVGIFTFAGNGSKSPTSVNTPVADIDIADQRTTLIQNITYLNGSGGTPTVRALYDVARYLAPVEKGDTGPSHSRALGTSPIIEGCQLSHVILMSDGQPNNNTSGDTTAKYIGYTKASNCQVITSVNPKKTIQEPKTSGGECGPSLTSWMSNVDQDPDHNGKNYIRTNTIGFALSNEDNSITGSALTAKNFLYNLAHYGGGKDYVANNENTLLNAFTEIISDVRAADSPSASGTVTIGEQARYEQRTEVFYSLYRSADRNYWPGNMKRFKIEYVDTPLVNSNKMGQRAVLVDRLNASAMNPDGAFYDNVSSFWSSSDGGKVSAGGVLGQLKEPKERTMYTLQNETNKIDLKSGANLDLGVDVDTKNGLLDFIRGYTYQSGGSNELSKNKKIGDAARGRITLATYGCSNGANIVKCDTKNLQQTALLASNDGFLRGYDIQTGQALFEYMPEEMLPLIQKLQREEAISFHKSRYYGLDGKPVIYHQDTNNDHYINNTEKAYAYIAAGRGGPYIYALDISSPSKLAIKWQIIGGQGGTTGFENLGYTWSTPTLGNMKIGGVVQPVLVFGGGYDLTPQESQIANSIDRDTVAKRAANKGNSLYIVNAESGKLIWSASDFKMEYGIPSAVALVTDNSNDKLITDIFVGDMGGQVWRFMIDNNKPDLSISGGVIADLAGNISTARKFYQAPSVSEAKINGISMLTVTIGSGFRNHPLNIDIQDRIYSLRVPKNPTTAQDIITENDLATVSRDGQSVNGSLSKGFMIPLNEEGEKVITDGYAGFDRFVYNTFTPSITGNKTCVPTVGTQRTYNYDLITGKSLLESAYISIRIAALPPDVTTYCDGRYCTIVSDPSLLSKEKTLPMGKEEDAFIVDTNPSDKYVKIGWTDLFDISK